MNPGRTLMMAVCGCSAPVLDPQGPGGPEPLDDTATAEDSGTRDDTATVPDVEDSGTDGVLTLCLNEFMADNESALVLEDGARPDWVELHNPGDTAVSLAGWTITDDRASPDDHEFAKDLAVGPGEFLLLFADGLPEQGPQHLDLKLSASGGELALFDPEGDGQVIVYGNVEDDFSVARVTDCCSGEGCLGFDFRGTPGASNEPIVLIEETVLDAGSTWSYWDRGSLPAGDWMAVTYDDSAWPSGPAPLGFGDSHLVTVIDGGPEGARHPTTWFRTRLDLDDLGTGARLSMLVDDGAVVWLNGEEALRVNMPEGTIGADTLASSSVGDATETTYYSYDVDAGLLVEGSNTIAVEVHQGAATSSDLGFDLAVVLERVQ